MRDSYLKIKNQIPRWLRTFFYWTGLSVSVLCVVVIISLLLPDRLSSLSHFISENSGKALAFFLWVWLIGIMPGGFNKKVKNRGVIHVLLILLSWFLISLSSDFLNYIVLGKYSDTLGTIFSVVCGFLFVLVLRKGFVKNNSHLISLNFAMVAIIFFEIILITYS